MKKEISRVVLLALALGAMLTSCRFEQDDYFDEAAANRIEHTNDNIQQALVAAPNGWVMQYFCGNSTAYFEGFNILAKFYDNGKVLMAGNHRYLRNGRAGQYTEHTSLYSLLRDEGPVLAFNSWNDILTPFVDPVSPWLAPTPPLVKDGEGMAGDNNFDVVSFSSQEIILRGVRHRATVRLIPATADWQQYLASVQQTHDYITSTDINQFVVTDGTDTLYFTGLNEGRIRYCERLVDPLQYDSLHCVFTTSGFRLENKTKLGEKQFQEFTITEDSTRLVSEDGSVGVYAIWQPYFFGLLEKNVNEGMLALDYESLTASQKAAYDVVASTIEGMRSTYTMKGIGFGQTTSGGNVKGLMVVYYTNTRQTTSQTLGLGLDYTVSPEYSVTIGYDAASAATNSNMQTMFRYSSDFEAAIRELAASLQGTYTVSPNNHFVPTGGQFQPVSGGSAPFQVNSLF